MPEYSSDEDDSDEECSKPSEKPLFPSSNTTNNQIVKSAAVLHESKKTDDVETNCQQSTSVSTNKSDQKVHKKKPSFASIITGGRSPQHETVDVIPYPQESDGILSRVNENPDDTQLLSQKALKRKRRIEFNVSASHAKRSNQNDEINSNNESENETDNTIATLRNKYGNFQKGETEFSDDKPQLPSSGTNDTATKSSEPIDDINDEQQLLDAKLQFLCQGRADVSPVQIIQIQLHVCCEFKLLFKQAVFSD